MPYEWMIKDVADMSIGDSRNYPHNWPGVDDDKVKKAQATLNTIVGKKFKVTKTSYDREHWLSLKVTRTA